MNEEYSVFQCSYLTCSIKPTYTFCVYGDDIELYDSGDLNWEAGCQEISVNVKNVRKLLIVVSWKGGADFDYGRVFMGDDVLLRELTDEDFDEIGD